MLKTAHIVIERIQIETIVDIAQEAGRAILDVYHSEDFFIETKDDQSPLTKADRISNEIIVERLRKFYPQIPLISEENNNVSYAERKGWQKIWLIDPLDGTKEFIKRNGEFTVNIGLVEDGVPVLGVVHAPALGITHYGTKEKGAFVLANGVIRKLPKLSVDYLDKPLIRVVASRSHMSEETMKFVQHLEQQGKQIEIVSMGSALKICKVAEGAADVYPRFSPTMEWDTAAAQAVAEAAGRKVLTHHSGFPLRYNKENLTNPWFIVC